MANDVRESEVKAIMTTCKEMAGQALRCGLVLLLYGACVLAAIYAINWAAVRFIAVG